MAWSLAKTALLTSAATVSGGGTTDRMKVWDGGSWVLGVLKVWDGAQWVPGSPKVWDGANWI